MKNSNAMLRMIFNTKLLSSEYTELTTKMLSVLDKDADGSISFDEFKAAMADVSKFEGYHGLKLKCHEYAGSMFAVPSERVAFLIVYHRFLSCRMARQLKGWQHQKID